MQENYSESTYNGVIIKGTIENNDNCNTNDPYYRFLLLLFFVLLLGGFLQITHIKTNISIFF